MIRSIATVLMLLVVSAAAASAQQTIGVGAVVLERVTPAQVELEIRSTAGGLSVREAGALRKDSRLLESTFVNVASDAPAATIPVRVHDSGTVRVEQRAVGTAIGAGDELDGQEALIIEGVEQLTVTRVVASNS